jgi:hypothetical protein
MYAYHALAFEKRDDGVYVLIEGDAEQVAGETGGASDAEPDDAVAPEVAGRTLGKVREGKCFRDVIRCNNFRLKKCTAFCTAELPVGSRWAGLGQNNP